MPEPKKYPADPAAKPGSPSTETDEPESEPEDGDIATPKQDDPYEDGLG